MNNEMIQLLSEDGTLISNIDLDLTTTQLRELYELMVLTRVFDEKSLKLQRSGKIGFYIGCKGQEASHIGSAYALQEKDWIFPSYRNPGILFLRKMPIKDLISQMMGNDNDVAKGRQMPCHFSYRDINFVSFSSVLSTQIPHAVGASLAAKLKGDKTVSIVYFGDGSTSEGDFHVGLNFAGVYKTPTVFLCENNQWAISLPFNKQTASESIAIKASAYGIKGVKVDGNDILAVYKVTKEAAERARNGEGSTLIESLTYRISSHSSSDDPNKYRQKEEVEEWIGKDPIKRFEKFLLKQNILTEDDIKEIFDNFKNQVDEAVREAEKFEMPKLETLFTDVYKEMPKNLNEQMNELLKVHSKFGKTKNTSQEFPL